ncbi:MAG: hypothetical protein JNK12_14265 [Acidimicrobiales bacterium]|nr:hypothetical protein [Acidimicrobiales bacterium]
MTPATATLARAPHLGPMHDGPETVLRPGDPVDVRNRFDGRWSTGFRVDAVIADDDGYRFRLRRLRRLRRLSDGAVLPALFAEDTVIGVR